jgi:two-component system OmpR family response regulator
MNPVQREILIIDGDEGARTLIGQILAEQGFAVTSVGDGSAALRWIEAKSFGLVITETRLPGPLDGIMMMRLARAQRPGLRCLFTSGFAFPMTSGNAEIDDFIAKPFHRRELVGCVFELLQRVGAVSGLVAADVGYCGALALGRPGHSR